MAVLLVLLGSVGALVALLVLGDRHTGGGVRRALRPTATDGPRPVGITGASITGTAPDGSPLSIALTGNPTPTLLAFLGSTCVTCDGLWRDADRVARRTRHHLRIIVVTRGSGAEPARLVAAKAPRSVPVVMSDDAWTAYAAGAAPAFSVVDGVTGTATTLDAPAAWTDVVTAARSAR